MAVLGLSCCTQDLSLRRAGYSLVAGHRLQSAWVPGGMGSVIVARRLSRSAACGILVPRPGIKPVSPDWKADS